MFLVAEPLRRLLTGGLLVALPQQQRMPSFGRPGFRILAAPPRLPSDLIERFRGLASSNLADAMGRFNFMDPAIQSRSSMLLCGLAVTVNARPADNLMVHKALQVATPGDVVVVSTGGNTTSAVFGELMCHTRLPLAWAASSSTAPFAMSRA
jgi:hypothetical protein